MPKENSSFFVLLGILGRESCSGYDIKKIVENEIGHYYKISNGQIYPALKKLMEMGYATLAVEKHDGKPDRKIYSITQAGRAVFRQWLLRPVDYQNPGGNELLLKLHFGALADIDHSMELISRHREKQAGMHRDYVEIEKNYFKGRMDDLQMQYSYITLQHGLALTQAGVEWCDMAMNMLNDMKKGTRTTDG